MVRETKSSTLRSGDYKEKKLPSTKGTIDLKPRASVNLHHPSEQLKYRMGLDRTFGTKSKFKK